MRQNRKHGSGVGVNERNGRRLAWAMLALFIGLAGVGNAFVALNGERGDVASNTLYSVVFIAIGFVGAFIASRQPSNPIGWILLGSAGVVAISFAADQYATYGVITHPGEVPGAQWAVWVSQWGWVVGIIPLVVYLFLLFPNGRVVSPRWRWVGWAAAVTVAAVAIGGMLNPTGETAGVPVKNPIGIESAHWLDDVIGLGYILAVFLSLASVASLIIRFRRSHGDERQQIKWLAYSGAVFAAWLSISTIGDVFGVHWLQTSGVADALSGVTFLLLPIATGVAILKYRLYDIDVVIRKTVVVGALAACITLIYVAVVVGFGALAAGTFQSRILPIVAAVLIAVAFQPMRAAARRLSDRLVLGKRATPYEVLSAFSERVGGTYATEDLLPRMARIVGEGTAAQVAEVWLRLGDQLRRAATWPTDKEPNATSAFPLSNGELPQLGDVSEALPVRHQGELLGAITVKKPPSEPLTSDERKLLNDLAAQAGLVLRNARLNEELRLRLEELQASRQRIVAAQDQERRRIERNIHDGAQQQLVALAVKLGLVRTIGKADQEKADQILAELQTDAQQALEDLRDLARGIYPPLLADQGLVAALEAQARKASLPVAVAANGVGRYPQEVEAAVYFCALEALQNIAKYAGATRALVRLSARDGSLTFEVVDDGGGFDVATAKRGSGLTNMSDRLSALGGALNIESSPGSGTVIRGRILA
jgi:signal transduction histidine kinase